VAPARTNDVSKKAIMYVARIRGKNVEFFEAETKCLKKVISVAIYGGPTSVDVQGEMAAITCTDRRIYIYEIKTGFLKNMIQRNPS
jgi:hypothetical protein